MPETSVIPVTTAQLTAGLAGLIHGPYSDASTSGAADLAAETVRYLNYAAAKGGTTDPATIAALTSSLATAAYRLPQLPDAGRGTFFDQGSRPVKISAHPPAATSHRV
jgi:hypothetical protein